jgi:hypothetical protein
MMAVTVVCDEKSMVDKAREWGTLSCRTKRGRTMSAVPQAFSKSARRVAPPVIQSNVKRQTRVLLPGESGPLAHRSFDTTSNRCERF